MQEPKTNTNAAQTCRKEPEGRAWEVSGFFLSSFSFIFKKRDTTRFSPCSLFPRLLFCACLGGGLWSVRHVPAKGASGSSVLEATVITFFVHCRSKKQKKGIKGNKVCVLVLEPTWYVIPSHFVFHCAIVPREHCRAYRTVLHDARTEGEHTP